MYLLEFAGEDDRFAAAEAGNAAPDVDIIAPGIGVARTIDPDRVRGLAYTRRASELLGRTDAGLEGARALVEASALERAGTAAVRARDVRGTAQVDTRRIERAVGRVLVERGFEIDLEDPDNVLRVACSADVCAIGWLTAESVRDFGARAPTDRPFFQPGSMDPLEARAVVNLAGAGPGATLLDPMCGTGGLLLEAGLLGCRIVGADAQAKMVRGTRRNLEHYLEAPADLFLSDAGRLPLRDGAVDAVAVDAPYGRQSRISGGDLAGLIEDLLREARRVAQRTAFVADRRWAEVAATIGWRVEDVFERRVHRSLVRYVHVLDSG